MENERMVKSKDLRIGNFVYLFYDENEQSILKFEFDSGWNFDYIKPIPLTEEWLVKFGFETDKIEWWNGNMTIGIFKDGLFFCPSGEITLRIGKEIKYVHQLQNLYYSIFGEDIELSKEYWLEVKQ